MYALNFSANYKMIATLLGDQNPAVKQIIMITKQWIYRQKCSNLVPTYEHLICEIQNIEKAERWTAHLKSKMDKHNQKWKILPAS